MARGYVWAQYLLNDATPYALRVDADYATDPTRGWVTLVAGEPGVPLPRGWAPRFVYGKDDTGAWRSTRIAHTNADLWIGTVTQFTILANDGSEHTVTVTGRREEDTRRRPH